MELFRRDGLDIVSAILDEFGHYREIVGIEAPFLGVERLEGFAVLDVIGRIGVHHRRGRTERFEEIDRNAHRNFAAHERLVDADLPLDRASLAFEKALRRRSVAELAKAKRVQLAHIQRPQEIHRLRARAAPAVAAAEFGEVMVAVARNRELPDERGDRPAEPRLFRRAVRGGFGDHAGEEIVERESFVGLCGIVHLDGGTGFDVYANLRHRGNLVHGQDGLVGVAHRRIVHVDGICKRKGREERVERLAERQDLADIRPVGFVQVRKIHGRGGVAVLRGGKFWIRLEKRVHLGRIRVEKPRAFGGDVGIHLRDRHRRPRPAAHERRKAIAHGEILVGVVGHVPRFAQTGRFAEPDIHREARNSVRPGEERIRRRMHDAGFELVCAFERRLEERGDLAVGVRNADRARNAAAGRVRRDGAEGEIAPQSVGARGVGLHGIAASDSRERLDGGADVSFDTILDFADFGGEFARLDAICVDLERAERNVERAIVDKRDFESERLASLCDGDAVESCLHVVRVSEECGEVAADCRRLFPVRRGLGGHFLNGGHNRTDAARSKGTR